MTVTEIRPADFNERLEPIFRSVESRLPEHLRGRKAEYFFPRWRALMDLGVARAWGVPGAVIGLLVTPDIFSGTSVAHVPFWFSLPGSKNALSLLRTAERAAKEAKCARFSIAAFSDLNFERMTWLYLHRGYSTTEVTFQKIL